MSTIPFQEAYDRMMGAAVPLPGESVGLSHALGRVLAQDVVVPVPGMES